MEQIINLDFFFRPISRRVHFTNLCFKDLCNDSSLDIKETIQNKSLNMEAFLVKKKRRRMVLSKAKETTIECDFFTILCFRGDWYLASFSSLAQGKIENHL